MDPPELFIHLGGVLDIEYSDTSDDMNGGQEGKEVTWQLMVLLYVMCCHAKPGE